MDTTADRLKKALSFRNMRQADLALETGIGKSAISQYVSGKVIPKQDKIYLLAKALHVNEGWLMCWTDDPIDYDDNDFIADIRPELITYFDGDVESAYKAQQAIENDALSDSSLHNSGFNERDKKDIAKNLEKIIADLEDETTVLLFYGGELPDEDKEILKGILEQALVVAKLKNKAKYTPKKYHNEQLDPQDD